MEMIISLGYHSNRRKIKMSKIHKMIKNMIVKTGQIEQIEMKTHTNKVNKILYLN